MYAPRRLRYVAAPLDEFQHLHRVLRQRLELLGLGAAKQLALAVREFRDVTEDLALRPLQSHGVAVREPQLAAQPVLDERVLPVVFVIADETGETVGQVPGPSPGMTLPLTRKRDGPYIIP